MTRLGLIAGNGRFPLIFAEAAQAEGVEIIAVAHEGETPAEIAALAPAVTWIKVGELGKMLNTFQQAGVTQAVMAGGISKAGAFAHFQPDARGMAFISRLSSLKDDVILRGVAQELESEGITIVESTRFLSALVPHDGTLTTTAPDAQQWEDIRFGFTVAKAIGRWDIGQSVVVKRGTVLAVEGVEGTNATIRRGGTLGGAGTVIVKVSKPQQDLRFDVPAVGPETIAVMQEVNATVLAVESGKTLMLDKPLLVQAANAAAISVIAMTGVNTSVR
jgi:UDP-2,3-diacylglucosamine hydrolase